MCAHNGTHIDAPRHFLRDGATIEQIPLEKTVGWCFVTEHEGEVGAEDARAMLTHAAELCAEASKKILIKGNAVVTSAAAEVFAAAGCALIGNESQSVGPVDAPMQVHLILLGAEVVLLEGIRLGEVEQGIYWLHAAPLKLGGAEGAPCRAMLIG
jgi:arylformamidase